MSEMVSSYNVMIDTETTGLNPHSAGITSIGAVFFMIEGWRVEKLCHRHMAVHSIYTEKFRSEPGTMQFRGQEGIDAAEAELPKFDLGNALGSLAETAMDYNMANWYVWAKPTVFDIAFLNRAYDLYCLQPFWHYRNVRDLGSFVAGCGQDLSEISKLVPFKGKRHSALDDANFQVDLLAYALDHR